MFRPVQCSGEPMTDPRAALTAFALGCGIVAACGGRTGGTTASDAGNAGDAGETGDASQVDAGFCVTIDASSFDRSCGNDSECLAVYAGVLCAGYNCICAAGGAINANEQARYEALVASVPAGSGPHCGCPFLGRAHCLQGQCVFCPSYPDPQHPDPPGCGDGG
jgi:hypothetical protein